MRKMDIRKKKAGNISKIKGNQEKAGNISKIKGNQETSDRVYGRYWT